MASSLVHLAIANELIRIRTIADPGRFRFGSIVADAGNRSDSHLQIRVQNGQKRTYDFDAFRRRFGERLLTDDLYLGYYLHLLQDVLFRRSLYDGLDWDPTPDNVARLHRDYSIVNAHLVEAYGLVNDLAVPELFEREALCELCPFDVQGFLKSMETYYLPFPNEPACFFTQETADAFIARAVAVCAQEIDDIRSGKPGIDMIACAWGRNDTGLGRAGCGEADDRH